MKGEKHRKSRFFKKDTKTVNCSKDPDAGKEWGHEEKGRTEYETVGWHHRLSGHEFERTPGDREGHGSLACCSPWGHKEWDTTEQLNNKFTLWNIMQSIKWVNVSARTDSKNTMLKKERDFQNLYVLLTFICI